MTREKLTNYKNHKKELALIEKAIDKLNGRLERIPEVNVKVQKSSDDFPYIEEHLTVKAIEPMEAERIRCKIREKERKRDMIITEMNEVEQFIDDMPEGKEKEIIEMLYLDGMKQWEVAIEVDCSRSRISQIIGEILKN